MLESNPIGSTVLEYLLQAIPDSVVDWIDRGETVVRSWFPSINRTRSAEPSHPRIRRLPHQNPFRLSEFTHPALDSDPVDPSEIFDAPLSRLTHPGQRYRGTIHWVLISNPFLEEPEALRLFHLIDYCKYPHGRRVLLYSSHRQLFLDWLKQGQINRYDYVRGICLLSY